jgi:hypothetical protein
LFYENHPDYFKTFEANIFESSKSVPDLLDEALRNLRCMLAVQNPKLLQIENLRIKTVNLTSLWLLNVIGFLR